MPSGASSVAEDQCASSEATKGLTSSAPSGNSNRLSPRWIKARSELSCDWFDFKFNAPSASHMGGIWERQIRTVRAVLSAILEKNGTQLNDEALSTFMCEAEAIVNSRPLTINNISSPDSLEALTPNHSSPSCP